MKKLFSAVCLAALCFCCFADAQKPSAEVKLETTYPFLLGVVPSWPSAARDYDVCGFKLGAPMCSGYGKVYGQEASIFYCGTDTVRGCQATLAGLSHAKYMEGLQASCGPAIAYEMCGFQASSGSIILTEGYGAQAGVVSIARSFAGYQTGALDLTYDSFSGFAFGVVNIAYGKSFDGCQIGGFNITNAEEEAGCQIGIFNYSKNKGFQIGAINMIRHGPIPFMLFFNMSF